jgi:flagellar basal-body rod modification protein FlgD
VDTAFNTFITLLTTQLQHQDPLNPTNTDTFTQELIQLSGVEQQLKTNSTLSSISTDLSSITQSNGLGYVGKTVTATGDTSPMQSGKAQWDYNLSSAAHSVVLTVQDLSGNAVFTTAGSLSAGNHPFTWNGQTDKGPAVTSGDYVLNVQAFDTAGKPLTTTTAIVGQVTGVDTSSGSAVLQLGDVLVPVSKVSQVS